MQHDIHDLSQCWVLRVSEMTSPGYRWVTAKAVTQEEMERPEFLAQPWLPKLTI